MQVGPNVEHQAMSEDVGKNMDRGTAVEVGGARFESLSFGDKNEDHPMLEGDDETKEVISPKHRPEKRPRIEDDGSGKDKSKKVLISSFPFMIYMYIYCSCYYSTCLASIILCSDGSVTNYFSDAWGG